MKLPKLVGFVGLTPDEKKRLERIGELLQRLDSWTEARAACLLGLTDDQDPNPDERLAKRGLPVSAGARTQELFRHVAPKLGKTTFDRELRDYVFKPLEEIGVVQKAYISPQADVDAGADPVIYGLHPKAKSPNSAYALTNEGRALLIETSDADWASAVDDFVDADSMRRMRARQQASMVALQTAAQGSTPHAALIQTSVEALTSSVARGFELAYIDDGDGPRGKEYEEKLAELGLAIELKDLQPDAILVKRDPKQVWFIDAVISDGEIDATRYKQLCEWAGNAGYAVAGAVTCYETWTKAGSRQHANKNIAPGTAMWIAEDGGKLIRIDSTEA